jgi:hypothetical protein
MLLASTWTPNITRCRPETGKRLLGLRARRSRSLIEKAAAMGEISGVRSDQFPQERIARNTQLDKNGNKPMRPTAVPVPRSLMRKPVPVALGSTIVVPRMVTAFWI